MPKVVYMLIWNSADLRRSKNGVRHVTDEMVRYVRNQKYCRWDMLLSFFGEAPPADRELHFCCDICRSLCMTTGCNCPPLKYAFPQLEPLEEEPIARTCEQTAKFLTLLDLIPVVEIGPRWNGWKQAFIDIFSAGEEFPSEFYGLSPHHLTKVRGFWDTASAYSSL